jgi:transcriptional regulator with XRE-family HTH domain
MAAPACRARSSRSSSSRRGSEQEDLGERCDLHRTEISLLERAGREPRLGTIVRLAGALGVTPGALCEGMTWEEDAQRFDFPPD